MSIMTTSLHELASGQSYAVLGAPLTVRGPKYRSFLSLPELMVPRSRSTKSAV